MESHVKKNDHFSHLLFALSQGSKAVKAAHDICASEHWKEVVNNNGEYIID